MLIMYFLLLVADATVGLDVNTTAGHSAVLPCALTVTFLIDLKYLRFYWQDERKHVWYSFNEGEEMPEHVNQPHHGRIAVFPQEMMKGNISVGINATLQDDQRVFHVFAAVFGDRKPWTYKLEHGQVCQHTLHVAVPYRNVSLAVNEEAMTAVCTAQRGYPEPVVEWRLQRFSNDSQHLLDLRDVNTTAVQDPQDLLYNVSSAINIPGGQYRSVICLIHDPTLNVTLSATYTLNKGEEERSHFCWAVYLIAAVVLVLILLGSRV